MIEIAPYIHTTRRQTAMGVARALLSIPRVAVRILLFPVLLAFSVLMLQLWLTTQQASSLTSFPTTDNGSAPQTTVLKTSDSPAALGLVRQLVYGSAEPRPALLRCRWVKKDSVEFPPGKDCFVAAHDVAISLNTSAKSLPPEFERVVERLVGIIDRVHFCEQECIPGAGTHITLTADGAQLTMNGFLNFLLLNEALRPENAERHTLVTLPGEKFLNLAGLNAPIALHGLDREMAKLLTVVMLVIGCVWLSLRAYRKVLDYFASSGSLLPLTAAVGGGVLYRALWLIALARVALFLVLALPLTVMALWSTEHKDLSLQITHISHALLWLIALAASLSLTTICASVADLNKRGSFAFFWRYAPVTLVVVGFVLWIYTLVETSESVIILRHILTALPLIGLSPILGASIIQPPEILLVLHAILAAVLITVIAIRNVRWFSSHVEEL